MIAVGMAIVPQYARMARGLCLTIRKLACMEAVPVVGSGQVRLDSRHFLSNIKPLLFVPSTLQFGQAIIYGSARSFLGIGAQPPTPEWGLIAAKGRDFFRKAWWISTFPSLAILSMVLAFNLLGNGLRGLLDPRMHMVRAVSQQNS